MAKKHTELWFVVDSDGIPVPSWNSMQPFWVGFQTQKAAREDYGEHMFPEDYSAKKMRLVPVRKRA